MIFDPDVNNYHFLLEYCLRDGNKEFFFLLQVLNMCGQDTSGKARGGARVDFYSQIQGALGNLIFLDPAAPNSSVATHVRFTPREDVVVEDLILVSIQ